MVIWKSDPPQDEPGGNNKKRKMPPALEKLCKTFHNIFKKELSEQLSPSHNQKYTIKTGDAAPINLNSYPLSPIHLIE
jgi:hypothetical protein